MLRSIPECKVFYIIFEEIKSQVSETFSAVSKSQDSSQTVPRFRDWIKSFGDLQFYFFWVFKKSSFCEFARYLIIFVHLTLNASVSLVFDRSPFLKYIKNVVILRIKREVRVMEKRWPIGTIPELRQVSTLPFKSQLGAPVTSPVHRLSNCLQFPQGVAVVLSKRVIN